jgi:hypothetical protein
MLVVDFMHEVELGVWKALFAHLIRILYAGAPNGTLVAVLDERYVLVHPTRARTHHCGCQVSSNTPVWPMYTKV